MRLPGRPSRGGVGGHGQRAVGRSARVSTPPGTSQGRRLRLRPVHRAHPGIRPGIAADVDRRRGGVVAVPARGRGGARDARRRRHLVREALRGGARRAGGCESRVVRIRGVRRALAHVRRRVLPVRRGILPRVAAPGGPAQPRRGRVPGVGHVPREPRRRGEGCARHKKVAPRGMLGQRRVVGAQRRGGCRVRRDARHRTARGGGDVLRRTEQRSLPRVLRIRTTPEPPRRRRGLRRRGSRAVVAHGVPPRAVGRGRGGDGGEGGGGEGGGARGGEGARRDDGRRVGGVGTPAEGIARRSMRRAALVGVRRGVRRDGGGGGRGARGAGGGGGRRERARGHREAVRRASSRDADNAGEGRRDDGRGFGRGERPARERGREGGGGVQGAQEGGADRRGAGAGR
mmetsp:Transcript_1462/g.5972  ORF Transcript_1462/g.5972 Transcript_1462/m.5972 type:complete len:401 (-) Transcript_1462:124-1326(-)